MTTLTKRKNIRIKRGEETKVCICCEKEKDVLEFRIFWYQATKRGKPIGEKERRRLEKCMECKGK